VNSELEGVWKEAGVD